LGFRIVEQKFLDAKIEGNFKTNFSRLGLRE